MNYQLLVCTALLLVLVLSECQAKKARYLLNRPQCTEKRQHSLELEMAKNAPFGPRATRRFPETYQETMIYCRDITRIVAQTEQFFKECYEKSIRDYAQILIYTTKRNLRKYCGKKGSKVVKEMLKLAPCANKHIKNVRANSAPMKCMIAYINATSELIHIKEDKIKIPHACCFFQEGIKCAEEFLTSIPCMRAHVPTLMEYFRTGTGSITELVCGEYNDQTDACERLGRPPTPTEKHESKRYLTPTSLLIDLIESMSANFTYSPNLAGASF